MCSSVVKERFPLVKRSVSEHLDHDDAALFRRAKQRLAGGRYCALAAVVYRRMVFDDDMPALGSSPSSHNALKFFVQSDAPSDAVVQVEDDEPFELWGQRVDSSGLVVKS